MLNPLKLQVLIMSWARVFEENFIQIKILCISFFLWKKNGTDYSDVSMNNRKSMLETLNSNKRYQCLWILFLVRSWVFRELNEWESEWINKFVGTDNVFSICG